MHIRQFKTLPPLNFAGLFFGPRTRLTYIYPVGYNIAVFADIATKDCRFIVCSLFVFMEVEIRFVLWDAHVLKFRVSLNFLYGTYDEHKHNENNLVGLSI